MQQVDMCVSIVDHTCTEQLSVLCSGLTFTCIQIDNTSIPGYVMLYRGILDSVVQEGPYTGANKLRSDFPMTVHFARMRGNLSS